MGRAIEKALWVLVLILVIGVKAIALSSQTAAFVHTHAQVATFARVVQEGSTDARLTEENSPADCSSELYYWDEEKTETDSEDGSRDQDQDLAGEPFPAYTPAVCHFHNSPNAGLKWLSKAVRPLFLLYCSLVI